MAILQVETYKGAHIILVQQPGEATCTGLIKYRSGGVPVTKDVMGPAGYRFRTPEDMAAVARAQIDELARMGVIHEAAPPP
ncbi:hypothetical protein N5J06_20100 [Ralstonia sp. CHL-2022]|uniref:Uncharacterized protein n=1 Tax=Ralstonia mojiangensis TaxID=2953895 RepID=A0ABT2LF11_9RALS|nr:hypothetical protein [Ralstonia mojiangensis]MCT7313283.1 hypothetical protein [Ralstonia mojiangensis]